MGPLSRWCSLVLLASCCAPPSSQGPALDLLGHRQRVWDGEGLLPLFDTAQPPLLRARGALAEAPEATMVTDHARLTLTAGTPEIRGDWSFVRLSIPPQPARDRGWLEVRWGPSRQRFAIGWAPPPTAHSGTPAQLRALLPTLPPQRRSWVMVDLARAERAQGDHDAARDAWVRGAHLALDLGSPTEATRRFRAAAFLEFHARRFRAAQRLLDRAREIDVAAQDRLGLARGDYYRGLLVQELGDYRQARLLFERAGAALRELGADAEAAVLEKNMASLLQDEGRHAEAIDGLERLAVQIEATASAADRAGFYVDWGWAELRAMVQGAIPSDLDRPRRKFETARALARDSPDAAREATVSVNLALVAYYRGDLASARKHIDEVRGPSHGYHRPFLALLEAKLLLDQGRFVEAEAAFGAELARAREESGGRPSDYTWRLHHGMGSALRRRGDGRRGLSELQRARLEMELVARQTALTAARAPFLSDRHELIDDLTSALLEQGELAEAFLVQDAARAQVLRALQTDVSVGALDATARRQWMEHRERWAQARDALDASASQRELLAGTALRAWLEQRQRDSDALARAFDDAFAVLDQGATTPDPSPASIDTITAALASDEVLVALARVGETWHAFGLGAAFGPSQIVHQRLTAGARPSAILGRLSHPIAHLYLIAAGHPDAAQLAHDRDERGARLIDRATISELPYAAILARPAAEDRLGPALVIGDPDRDLPFAAREAQAVAARLGDGAPLLGGLATRARTLAALDRARVFHFAGHGVIEPGHPWDAHVSLAGSETLSLSDVLIARPRLGLVVLSGCETGTSTALSRTERVGLAEAFLIAGARTVLAAVRPIDDGSTLRFMERFYDLGGAHSPAEALRRATREAEERGDDIGHAFRLVGLR